MTPDSDYWVLEGFDRVSEALVEEYILEGRSNREWGDLFGRPADDPLLGEWEVTDVEAPELEAHVGVSLDRVDRIYFVGRRRDEWKCR